MIEALASLWLAQAQAPCAPRDMLIERLDEQYGEQLQSLGLQPDGSILEIYANLETGTFTVLVSRPDGSSCMSGSGQMWEQNVQPLDKPGEPT